MWKQLRRIEVSDLLNRPKILLLGRKGYLAGFFLRHLEREGWPYQAVSRADEDYTQIQGLTALLRRAQPGLVLNLAGFTGKPNVDECEIRREECWEGNVEVPVRMAQACENLGIPLGHVSSGCVFQGSPDPALPEQGFREEDAPNFSFDAPPCSYYSGCKAEAEKKLRKFSQVYLWRLRMPFWHRDEPRNLLAKLARYPRILDGLNSITHAEDFVAATLGLVARSAPFGTYHICNPGPVRTLDMVRMLEKKGVRQGGWEEYHSDEGFRREHPAPRSTCVLDVSKIARFGIQMRPARAALEDAIRRWSPMAGRPAAKGAEKAEARF